jgi:deoxycytidine triphosphate deaminase
MPINGQTVKHRAFVIGAKNEQYKAVGYDLTVGQIYVPKDGWLPNVSQKKFRNKVVDSYELPPQGVAVIFSAEAVELPEDVCAYAMPKTSLCAAGLLVLNTGIVDPKYRGPLSGTIVNFTDMTYSLKNGDPFLRLTFEQIEKPILTGPVHERQELSKQEWAEYRSQKMVNAFTFPATFLDIPDTVRFVSRRVLKTERRLVFWMIGVLGFMLTFVTSLPLFFPEALRPTTPTQEQIERFAKDYEVRGDIQQSLERLGREVQSLRSELRSRDNQGTTGQGTANEGDVAPN